MPSLAHQIKAARLRQGLSRADVARAVGTTIPTICRWERGTHEPSLPFRGALADLLDLPQLRDMPGLADSSPLDSSGLGD